MQRRPKSTKRFQILSATNFRIRDSFDVDRFSTTNRYVCADQTRQRGSDLCRRHPALLCNRDLARPTSVLDGLFYGRSKTAAVIIWRAIVYSPIEQSIANVFASKRKKRYAALQRLRFGEKSLTKRSRQWPVQQGRRAIARLALPRQGFPKHAIGLTLGAPSRKPNRQV